MKTKFLSVALVASAVTIAQANPVAYHGGGGRARAGGVAHAAPGARAPVRAGGFSSFHSTPMRAYGGRPFYSGQRYSSFGMRSYRPAGFRQSSIYPNGVTITRSGPYTAATIGQPGQSNRFPRYSNYRSPAATSVWNQRNTGNQFRNGNASAMETIVFAVTGKSTSSGSNRGIGIATGTDITTIGGMAIAAASSMDLG